MKAATFSRYGPPGVMAIADVTKPVPGDDEILIKVHATTVNSADCRIRGMNMPAGFGVPARLALGWNRPKQPILGTELSGVVETVGRRVADFRVGNAVFADTGTRGGAHAEYVVVQQGSAIAYKPASLGFAESAALCFGGATATIFLRDKAKVQPNEKLLINGATGAVGCAAIQLAKHLGANVTSVCSAGNTELALSLGSDRVIDYAVEDFTTNGEAYDVIMDNVGNTTWRRCRHALTETGRLLLVAAGLPDMLQALYVSRTGRKKILCGVANADRSMLAFLAELADGRHYRPVIDRSYPLARIVEAHAHVDTRRKRGSVGLTVGKEGA